MLNAELLPQRRLTQATVAFFETIQRSRDEMAPDPEAAKHWLQADQPPAFLPLTWLLAQAALEPGRSPDVTPTPHEALWIARLQGRLDDTEALGLDNAEIQESNAWRQFAKAFPVPFPA